MAQVRADFGPDALILATARVSGGVEVTAALDGSDPFDDAAAQTPRAAPVAASSTADARTVSAASLEQSHTHDHEEARLARLLWHGVPMPMARRLRSGPLAFALSVALRFAPLELSPDAPVVVVGPHGAGKTLTVVRLATRLVLAGQKPIVVCADVARAGALDQLAAFTRLLGVELVAASKLREVDGAVRKAAGRQTVLVDTPAFDPDSGHAWHVEMADGLRELVTRSRARVCIALPAGMDAAEAADVATGHRQLGAGSIVATRLDASRRLGGILAAAGCGLALSELGVGPGAADGLVPATPDLIAKRLSSAADGRSRE